MLCTNALFSRGAHLQVIVRREPAGPMDGMPFGQPLSEYVCLSEALHARPCEGGASYEQVLVAARSGSAGTGDALVAAAPDSEGLAQSPAPRRRLLDRDVVDGRCRAELAMRDARAPSLANMRCISRNTSTGVPGKR